MISAAFNRTSIDRAIFTYRIAITYYQPGRLTSVAKVLRSPSQRNVLKNLIVAANGRRSVNGGMVADVTTACDFYLRTNHGVGANRDVFSESCGRINYGRGVNH
jgi:hypothetical protein